MTYKLLTDISRCNGLIQVGKTVVMCPQRENCLRYLDREREHPWMSFLLVVGAEKVGNCDEIIENEND
jgi:hypothetical protein